MLILNDDGWLLAFAVIVVVVTLLIMAASIYLYHTIRSRNLARAIVKHTTSSKSGRSGKRSSR